MNLPNTTTNAEFVGGGSTLTGIGTIQDDDVEPYLVYASDEVSADENDGKLVFTVNVIDPETESITTSGKEISADYISLDLVRGGARQGTDYHLTGSNLTIPAGQSSGTITLTLVESDIQEATEIILFNSEKSRQFYI